MIDFTTCKENKLRAFGGGNGFKISIVYGGKNYMLKYPPKPQKNKKHYDIAYLFSKVKPSANSLIMLLTEGF